MTTIEPTSQPGGHRLPRRTVITSAVGLGTAAVAASWLPARAAEPSFTLASAGSTRYRILVGTAEDAVTRHAATELADWLQRVTGATFPVVALSRSNTPTSIRSPPYGTNPRTPGLVAPASTPLQ